jgi:hypothetical protein
MTYPVLTRWAGSLSRAGRRDNSFARRIDGACRGEMSPADRLLDRTRILAGLLFIRLDASDCIGGLPNHSFDSYEDLIESISHNVTHTRNFGSGSKKVVNPKTLDFSSLSEFSVGTGPKTNG